MATAVLTSSTSKPDWHKHDYASMSISYIRECVKAPQSRKQNCVVVVVVVAAVVVVVAVVVVCSSSK